MMLAQLLAGIILIPVGLRSVMRGSDGLNSGEFSAGEAGVMAIAGGGMVLSGVALLIGLLLAGALALLALAASTVVWIRQRRRSLGRLRPGDLVGQSVLVGVVFLLVVAGWR